MEQRNMSYTSPMNNLEMDQESSHHIHHEPCIIYGNISNYPQPHMHVIIPDHHGHPSYGMMNQYNATQHHHVAGNLDLPAAAASTQYNNNNIYMNHPPSGTRVFPVPLTHGPHDQFQFSPNHGINEFHVDGYNNHFVDGAFKRKNAEGIPGNFQYCYTPAGPSYAARRPLDSDLNLMESGSAAVGIGDSGLPHNPSHMIQGNHLGQPFQIPANPWLTQHFSNSGGEIRTLAWNQPPALPYIHGSVNGGCLDTPNMNIQAYQVTAGNRNTYVRPPSIPLHHPPPLPPMHAIRGPNIEFHPQVSSSSSSSRRVPANISNFQDGRFVGTAQQSGLRIYRPHRRDLILEAAQRQTILPQLRVLPEDGVAILEFSGYHEVGEATDHHRDMRLDIDHMSYEELLELGEHIGNVGTGLSDESIINHLKRKTFITCSCLENTSGGHHELEFCVVCQNEYKDQEKMGVLDCEHEFHEECIKKWLIEKNICPICKSPALNTDRKK